MLILGDGNRGRGRGRGRGTFNNNCELPEGDMRMGPGPGPFAYDCPFPPHEDFFPPGPPGPWRGRGRALQGISKSISNSDSGPATYNPPSNFLE